MKPKYISAAILLIVAIVIGIFSYNTVWLGDDINYAFDFREDHRDEIVSSFTQIIQSMNAHYMTENGRHVPHILVSCFCGLWGHLAFAIVNGLFYVAFILALCKLCKVTLSNVVGLLSVTIFALIVFQTKMTPSCQIGYIWNFTEAMIFLILFFTTKERHDSWWQLVLLGVYSLIAGNGNEALNIGICCAMWILLLQNKGVMPRRQYIMMACFCVGTLVICLSPGARMRAAEINRGAIWLYYSMVHFFVYQRATFVMIAIILYKTRCSTDKMYSIYKDNSFYLHIWLVMLLFNFVLGFQGNKQVFGAELAAIIVSIRILKNHRFSPMWLVVSLCTVVLMYYNNAKFLFKTRRSYDEIEKQYAQSEDGRVYVDIDNSSHMLNEYTKFNYDLPFYGCDGYHYEILEKYFTTKYPDKDPIRILPTMLKGCDNRRLSNGVYKLKQEGIYLFIQNSSTPQIPVVTREIDTILFSKKYEPTEIDFTDAVLWECDNWKACYLADYTYKILEFSKVSFSLN